MAEAGNSGEAAKAGGGQASLGVIAQYVKDLSFENPGAPNSLRPRQKPPTINISIGVQSTKMNDTDHEVELKLDARAVEGETVLFVVELVYAGAFRILNVPANDLQQVTMIECPRL